jgi:hypothetical protein
MKAYLLCSPEFSFDTVKEVAALLNGIPGEIQFEVKKTLPPDFYTSLNIEFECVDENSELSFEELFQITRVYRSSQRISENDFVVFITSIRNDQQWFSAFNKKDIFIHGAEWDLISNIDSKFQLAFQCIENIFQSLINLRLNEYHEEPEGCINDFCGNKTKILIKLQTGNICQKCFERARQYGLNDVFLSQLIKTLEIIKGEFSLSKKFSKEVRLDPVRVSENGEIWIGEKYIDLEFRLMILYLGFLTNIEGISAPLNCKDKKVFVDIYKALSDNPDDEVIQRIFCKEITTMEGVKIKDNKVKFFQYKTKVHDALKLSLGDSLSKFYEIHRLSDESGKFFFRVMLQKKEIKFPEKFTRPKRSTR